MYRHNFILQYQRNYQACCWRFEGGYFNLYSEVGFWTPEGGSFWNFSCYKVLKASLIILLWKHKTSSLALNLVGSQRKIVEVCCDFVSFGRFIICEYREKDLLAPKIRDPLRKLWHKEQTCVCQGGQGWGRDDLGFRTSRCKLLYITWINNEVLLSSTGNYILYPEIKA